MVPVREIGMAMCGAAALLALVGFSSGASAHNESEAVTMLGAPLTLVQSTAALSPPTLRFHRDGLLHAAWIEKNGVQGEVKTAAVPADHSAITQVSVHPPGAGPEAVHQSPGFAIGGDGEQFVTLVLCQ
jgi:hypothetical protein